MADVNRNGVSWAIAAGGVGICRASPREKYVPASGISPAIELAGGPPAFRQASLVRSGHAAQILGHG